MAVRQFKLGCVLVVLAGVMLAVVPTMADVGPESDTDNVYWDDQFGIPGTSGTIYAMATDATGKLYAGGTFLAAGTATAFRVAKWNGSGWSAMGTGFGVPYSSAYDRVNAIACDVSGNVYVGGGVYGGSINTLYARVQKWDGNAWTILPSVGSINWQVDALACDAFGNLYAGGEFYGGRDRVAEWNGTSWSALGTGTNHYVYALACDSSGNLYAGGQFTTAGSVTVNYIARWDGTAWSALGTGTNGIVRALAVDGSGNLYAGGEFSMAGGVTVNRVAKWDGTAWSALGTGVSSTVYAVSLDHSGNLYAGGYLTTAGGVTATHVAKWDGTAWSALDAGISNYVNALACDLSGNFYAGGSFNLAGSSTAVSNVASWNGSVWSALGTGINGTVYALTSDTSGNFYVGGSFTSPGNRLAKWDGRTLSPLGSGLNNSVSAVTCDSAGILYAGGSFTAAGGVFANRIAKWDGSTWSPLGNGMNSSVAALACDGSRNLYAGGGFSTAGDVTASRVAKWDGSTWSALGTGLNDYVYALVCDGSGNLYAGGRFTTADGVSAKYVAKWDGNAWSPLGTGVSSDVYSLSLDPAGNLFAGGQFSTAGGVSAQYVAKWDGTTWSALSTGTNIKVQSVACDASGNVYAGGGFGVAGGVTAKCVAKWNGAAWTPLASGITSYSTVYALNVSGNTLFTGGSFTSAGGKISAYAGEWQPRVEKSQVLFSESPVAGILGNTPHGFYRPALETCVGTTVSYSGGLPVTATLDRAEDILVGGKRVNGAFTLGPTALQFGGTGATLRVEFSEDDAAAYGFPYTDFRVARLIYPADYPANKQAITVALLSREEPVPFRIENGRQIYAISVPFAAIASTYGAVPQSLVTPDAPSSPGATAIGTDTITWTWHDNSDSETGFKIWEDSGAGPPTTPQITMDPDVQSWPHLGLSTNTQYAFQVAATNANGDSDRTSNYIAWTLIEPVMDLTFGVGNMDTLHVASSNTPSNLASGASGLFFANTTAVTDSGWLQTNDEWASIGLTPNTQYVFSGKSRNGEEVETAAVTASKYTLCGPPSVGNNVTCDKLVTTLYPAGTTFSFTNPAGFGAGTHGDSAYRVGKFTYAWDTNTTYEFTGMETDWNTGSLTAAPSISGDYYLHLQSFNQESVVGGTLDYGPFRIDVISPTVAVALVTSSPSGADSVEFSVTFSEPVVPTFDNADVVLTGTMSGVVALSGTDPSYTVTVTLSEPDADGTVGISIATGVSDSAGNPCAGGTSPLCSVYNWLPPYFTPQPAGGKKYTGNGHSFVAVPHCGANTMTYQWKWGDGSKAVQDGPTTPSWDMAGLLLSNAGTYWCEATYDGATHDTDHVTLDVKNHVQITGQPAGADKQTGQSHTFTVVAADGYAPLSYRWMKNASEISNATGASYTLTGLAEIDSGTYAVEVYDANSDVLQSHDALLTVTQGLPIAGVGGLIALASLVALAGLRISRRR